ncbi:MAG: alkaline phosphatase family protein [Chloroflexi bacterium]|nr:alkaline phosphatase family protein [Chloroflexota bacterium]
MPPDDAPAVPPRRRARSGSRRRADVAYEDLGRVGRRHGKSAPERRPGSRQRGLYVLVAVLVVASVAGAAVALTLHRDSSPAALPGPARFAVVFVIDGAGPADLDPAGMPNLRALERDGIRYDRAWVGQFPPSITASSATLGTGRYPRDHGVLGDMWWDSRTRQIVSSTDPNQVRLGSLDQMMEARGGTALPVLLKTRYPGARVLSVGGAGCASASAAGTWLADYVLCPARFNRHWVAADVTGHDPPAGFLRDPAWRVPVARGPQLGPLVEGWSAGAQDDWIARAAIWAMRRTHPQLTIINFPELENLLPWASPGQRAAIVGRLLSGIDRDIGAVLRELRRERAYDRAVFLVTSDQAVAPIRHHVSRAALDEAILAAGGDRVYIQADEAARIGLRDHLQAEPVAQGLQAENLTNVDAIYYKVPAGAGWAYRAQYLNPSLPRSFPAATVSLLATSASAGSPDVVEAYAPGTSTRNDRIGSFPRTGASGGFQWDNQHIPLVISGHGVVTGARSAYPARLVDVAPTLAALLGLPPFHGDGAVLADALANPPSGAEARQTRTDRQLEPLVNALEQRARAPVQRK